VDTRERDRHEWVPETAGAHHANLDPTLSTRDPQAARRTVERNDTLPALSLFARPDEESRWTQIEAAE
jgi:hypothetical protein